MFAEFNFQKKERQGWPQAVAEGGSCYKWEEETSHNTRQYHTNCYKWEKETRLALAAQCLFLLLAIACLATIAIQWLELATVFYLHPAQWNMTSSASTFLLLGLLCLKYENSLSGFGRKISPFHHQPLGLASQDNKNTRFGAKEIWSDSTHDLSYNHDPLEILEELDPIECWMFGAFRTCLDLRQKNDNRRCEIIPRYRAKGQLELYYLIIRGWNEPGITAVGWFYTTKPLLWF